MKSIKNKVAQFVHEDECKGEKKSIGRRYDHGIEINHGWFCSGCNRLMISGKMFEYLFDCPREEVEIKVGNK